jgi:1,4-alpha-glucan branching enzyme
VVSIFTQKQALNNYAKTNNNMSVLTDKSIHSSFLPKSNTYSALNLKAYHLTRIGNISFGRTTEEHKSWGATVKPDGSVSFKVWAPYGILPHDNDYERQEKNDDYSNEKTVKIEKIFVEARPSSKEFMNQDHGFINIEKNQSGKIKNITSANAQSTVIELKKGNNGIYEGNSFQIKDGYDYRYIIAYEDGQVIGRKDPQAKRQKHISSWSTVYDHNKFKWNDSEWCSPNNKKRIGRNNPNLLPKIVKLHVGVAEAEGNYDSIKRKVDKIAKEGKFNAIELMPVEGCYFDPKTGIGYNWNYDGVDKQAPNEIYGDPDKLKELINHAHEKGINIIMDWVPNHMGPFGNRLNNFAPYSDDYIGWGRKFNYESKDQNGNVYSTPENKAVRDYMSNNALNWIMNYHVDGLRFDMTKYMGSDYALKQLSLECRFHAPHLYITAEDGRENGADGWKLNNAKVIRKTAEDDHTFDEKLSIEERERLHNELIEKIANNNTVLDNYDFDSQWDFAFHHSMTSLLLNEEFMGYNPSLENFEFALKNGPFNTKYSMSHDEIGNIGGTRLVSKILTTKLNIFDRINGESDDQKRQRASLAGQRLLEEYYRKDNDKSVWNDKTQKQMHIHNHISKEEFENALKESKNLNRLSLGAIFAAPGPKMVFDGDERGAISPFKFFAKYPDDERTERINKEKSYKTDIEGFNDSKLDQPEYINEDAGTKKYTDDLFKLLDESPALRSQKNDNNHLSTYIYNQANVVHVIKKQGKDKILAVMNFSNTSHKNFTLRSLPQGEWEEIINSNSSEYGGDNSCLNNNKKPLTNNIGNINISLPKQSIVFFKLKDKK